MANCGKRSSQLAALFGGRRESAAERRERRREAPPIGPGQSFSQFYSQFGLGRVANFFVEIWADLDAIWVEEKLLAIANIYSPPRHPRAHRQRTATTSSSEMRRARRAHMGARTVTGAAHKQCLAGPDERCLAVMTAHHSFGAPTRPSSLRGAASPASSSLWHPPPPSSSASSRCATTCSATPS